MGIGNVGKFIAHALRGVPNAPPVTLIFPRWDRLKEWNESPQKLTLITDGDAEVQEGYDAELAIPRLRYHGEEVGLVASSTEKVGHVNILEGESTEPISSLIVCSKASFVLQGLSSVKHRLSPDSVILFLQNGMGIVEQVNREIFPDPAARPHYMLGINSHGMHASPNSQFATVHAGFGTMSLGILPHERDRSPDSPFIPKVRFTANENTGPLYSNPPNEINPEYPPPSSAKFRFTPNQRYLLRTLLRTPVLGATSFSPPDLLQMQLDKLAVNCVINPLTALLDARNGAVLNNYAITRTMRLLLSEISLVIRSLPELQYIPNVEQRFDPGRLETRVVAVARITRDNVSSMLADTRKGVQTEIDYINGWIVKRGEELGIKCAMNYMVMQLVKGKTVMVQHEIEEGVPLVEDQKARGDAELKVGEGVATAEAEAEEGKGQKQS
ncbi:2-dehydropantoate 2-reductase [Stemphylium lycopersici]|uniref:2-dehydropantoate 2-reductase n=1 Tax=Stemphylium lycopersici TaxID=183478 RepID=A0A364N025_STELY|nr:2-dehydropantoate 2-reductase [Stemphylium lycopersici]RAR00327.1 2-dehydropantoate 2-reductase [Stemphylium lycopersici]RAR08016.1 2-dehydropantoate 2-reductase [Stemphylium lycopersici]